MAKKLYMSYEKKKGLYGYGFIALWFVGALMFFIIPVCQSFFYSFNDVKPETGYLDKKWVGIANYKRAFMTDPSFRQDLITALENMAFNLPVIIIFSLFVAIIINQKFRGRTFARAVFFLPVIIATGPVYAIITGNLDTNGNNSAEQFSTMFEADMVDQLLEFVGIYGFNETFTELLTTLTSDILNLVWKCGIQIIIFLSALQGIPTSAKEAASIEGATAWEFFWKITLPYISPMILVNIVYTVIDAFTDPTNEVMIRVLDVQSDWQYGYSAALAWSYFGIILVALGIIFAIMNKLVWYEGE
ncbi:MAG: sugar ABC transporter permease [Oscillospiraceae bacterium]|nr:sugar ABC transporter permease [Oscillospiraceae bacterium]